jgi:hypothetical protein
LPRPSSDFFPEEAFIFIDELLEEQPAERPTKRRRVEGPIEIYNEELVITRRTASASPSRRLSRPNAGASLHFKQAETSGPGVKLELCQCAHIYNESTSWLSINLPEGISETISSFIEFGDLVPRGRRAGDLVMAVDLDLQLILVTGVRDIDRQQRHHDTHQDQPHAASFH